MPEKDIIFTSKVKYKGIFPFSDFYNFCYDWLTQETDLLISEDKYKEKLTGEAKDIEIEWTGTREVTDYFKFEVKVKYRILDMTNVEVTQNGKKIKTNKGDVELNVKGILVRDYKGKFEKTAFQKFMRGIYEKAIIHSRVEELKDKLIEDCNEFLNQAKAYLDLEGRR